MNKPEEKALEEMVKQAMPASRPRSGKNARRLELVECAIRAQSYGRLALIPFAGLIYGPLAFYSYSKSRLLAASGWHPGRVQAVAGGVLGFLGFAASVVWMIITLS